MSDIKALYGASVGFWIDMPYLEALRARREIMSGKVSSLMQRISEHNAKPIADRDDAIRLSHELCRCQAEQMKLDRELEQLA